MNEKNLTVQEASELLLLSQSSVYAWIEKGKLKTIDSPTGKLIVISNNEIERIRELNYKSRRNKVSKQSPNPPLSNQEIPVIDVEFTKSDEDLLSKNSEVNIYLVKQLEKYAVDAGQFKQLELIRKQEKDDLEHWKSEYFALKMEKEKLQERLTAAESELSALKSAKRPFWRF